MATMQKPKKDRTKKTKTKQSASLSENCDEQEEEINFAISKLSEDDEEVDSNIIHISNENTFQNIPQIECNIAEIDEQHVSENTSLHEELRQAIEEVERKIETKKEYMHSGNEFENIVAIVESNENKNHIGLSEAIECSQTIANSEIELKPTAPPIDVIAIAPQIVTNEELPPIERAQYPTLTVLERVETKSKIVYKQINQIKSPGFCLINSYMEPYTEEQFKKFYHCAELDIVKQFELDFLMNTLLESCENDPLYAELLEYYNLQCKLSVNQHDVESMRKDARESQSHIWRDVPITKTFTGHCGDAIEVQETCTWNVAQVDNEKLEKTSAALNRLYDMICYTYTTNLITSKISKIKIDQMINEIISYPGVSNWSQAQEIILLQTVLDPETLKCVSQLRRAISICFIFIRKQSPTTMFDNDLKSWLRKLISLLLVNATKEDHWFLLFNVLRCPNGVGSWAAEFIQVPCSLKKASSNQHNNELPLQLNSPELNHCIAVLQILLLPIKKRNEYLKEFGQKEISDPIKEERWILVDSDGEDSHTANGDCIGLKESDLIVLLNQIPFEKIFTSALSIEKFLNDYIIEADIISSNQMLKVIAFLTKLIEIFGEGMLTYNNERYKQLAKRLGRLMRHALQYASEFHELFIGNNATKDSATCERIAVELNVLLLRACKYIYRTRNLATWQYFSSLPFHTLPMDAIWHIFYYLNVGFPNTITDKGEDYLALLNASDFWMKFNVANADSSAEDLYYLLQAFFEIASERDKTKDWELIKTICLHIFYIGFINQNTRDICYKTSRDMLMNLTLEYEDLMTSLLFELKIKLNETENAIYLFKSLPLENWKPGMENFEIISNWLLHYDIQSKENLLARIIISHLNWCFDTDGRLFLPHNIHVRMACLVADALTKHAPEIVGLSTISESVRQVSSLIDFNQSTKEQFATWCWSMVSLLRLHLMDQNAESIKKALQNPAGAVMFLPELEKIDLIYEGVTENRPIAIYVALLVSLHGHSIPLICQKGFDLLKQLLNDQRHAAVIRCIEFIVPIFLETPETLANCENFHFILNALLNADKTYLKMAKDMIYSNPVGPVLELLDNMIHHQITTYSDYGLSSPLNLINVWLTCFINLPNWQQTNVVYLLDRILRVSYQFSDARIQAIELLRHYFKDCDEWKGNNKLSSIKSFFGSTATRLPQLSPSYAWLGLVMLEIEFKTQDTHFWLEFLRQMSTTSSTTNIDNVLKKTLSVVKIPQFSANMLVLYKYAYMIAHMDIKHAMFPIMNQKFFELYLSRVPVQYDENRFQTIYGVADKFYQGNIGLMKKIKNNLKAAEIYYADESTKKADNEVLSHIYRSCAKLMKTFMLWLEETSINNIAKGEQNFPPQYNNPKLYEILNGDTQHWTEFIYLPAIRKEQRNQADQWARKCFRLKTTKQLLSPLQPRVQMSSIERIKSLLRSYDKQLNPPKYVIPDIYIIYDISKVSMSLLNKKLQIINDVANKFNLQTSELNYLNRNYLENVILLFEMQPYEDIKMKSCSTLLFNRKCSSPAHIVCILESKRTNITISNKIKNYCEKHDQLINNMMEQNVEEFAKCVQELQTIVNLFIKTKSSKEEYQNINRTSIEFFYAVIKNMTDITMKFPPTNDLYNHILNALGIFIQDDQENQGLPILELTFKRSDLLKVLSDVFVPYRTRPEYFLKMYKYLIDSYLKQQDLEILFVLLSKFDLVQWLETFQPKLNDINKLLQMVLHGLECWSQSNANLLLDQFRRHLVHIFNYDFPQHYGEVLQLVLDRVSDQKIMPIVLIDLLNALLTRYNCENLTLKTKNAEIREICIDFARRQNLFNLKAVTDTITLFACHFQKERLHHGLHGLYPKHKDYCQPLAMWFSCLGHVAVFTAICTYQELLADQICDIIFGSLIDMYSPWLITYTEQILQQQPTSKWIRQLTENGKVLYPWSEQHAKTSRIIIAPFIDTLTFVLDNLPVSIKILAHTFSWYVHHFSVINMETHLYVPIHDGISKLPWEKFKPNADYIDMLYDSLEKYIPESHAMHGHIFIRIDWNDWFAQILPNLSSKQIPIISKLFTIFIKIAFEPNIHIHINTSKILEDAINYPWYMVTYSELENLFKWLVRSIEPSIILNIPTETNYADRAVLSLLKLTCAMMPENPMTQRILDITAKRVLYTRSTVHLLRLCAIKNHKFLVTKDGIKSFNFAFLELLLTMNAAIESTAADKTLEECRRDATNLMIEIILPMQTESEEVSNFQIESIVQRHELSPPGNLLFSSTLPALGHMKIFIAGSYKLLDSSIAYYFRTAADKEWHKPNWVHLIQILQMSLEKLEMMPILNDSYILTLHIYILYQLEKMPTSGDQIMFLQNICQLVEHIKTEPITEPRLAIIWGLIISYGAKLLVTTPNVKKPLMMLARTLQILSSQAESWGDGLLSAIGLKKDVITNKRRVLTRCLACVILSLFPNVSISSTEPSENYYSSVRELSMLLANKKYQDVKDLIVTSSNILKDNQLPQLRDIPHLVCRLISIFYQNGFIISVPEVWDFDYKLK